MPPLSCEFLLVGLVSCAFGGCLDVCELYGNVLNTGIDVCVDESWLQSTDGGKYYYLKEA